MNVGVPLLERMAMEKLNSNAGYTNASAPRVYANEQIARYARKSTKGENASRSIEDQDAEMLEMLHDHGLPEGVLYPEKPGHAGSLWYKCQGKYSVAEERLIDEKGKPKHRPLLSTVVAGILNGAIKMVVCWSQDRTWRSVSICDFLCDMMVEYGVELYDRYGRVDIHTPDGRSQVRNTANAAQAYREAAKVLTRRGQRRNRLKGKLVSNPNCLGMRTAGKKTNKVIFIEEELTLLRKMMELYLGDDPRGPMSLTAIAKTLDDEGHSWPEDLCRFREDLGRAFPDDPGKIQAGHIRESFRNSRYWGIEHSVYGDYPCEAFLRNGETCVPLELLDRVKAKMDSESRVAPNGREQRSMTSLIVCGICGHPFKAGLTRYTHQDGTRLERWSYVANHDRTSVCTHTLPSLKVEVVDDYLATVLGPIVASHLSEQKSGDRSSLGAAISAKQLEIQELLRQKEEDLVQVAMTTWRGQPELAVRMAEALDQRVSISRSDLARLQLQMSNVMPIADAIGLLESSKSELRRDAVRAMIRWMAVIPSGLPKERTKKGVLARNRNQGLALFLTSLGTFHTARIEFDWFPKMDLEVRTNILVPAEPSECLLSVGDLPDPKSFFTNLRRTRLHSYLPFSEELDAPGYHDWLSQQAADAESTQ